MFYSRSISVELKHFLLLIFVLSHVEVESKRSYSISFPGRSCDSRPKEIDGAVLYSSYDRHYANTVCVMRFMADDDLITSKKLMLKFKRLNITDCSVSLQIFYSSTTYGTPDVQLNCNNAKAPVLYSNSKYMTLRLDRQTITTGYDFEIVLTTFKSGIFCGEFKCRNDKCIDKSLMCDGVDHCFDNSDESFCTGINNHHRVYSGSTTLKFSLIPILIIICIIAGCVYGVYKRRLQQLGAFSRGHVITLQQPMYCPPSAAVMNHPPPEYYAPGEGGFQSAAPPSFQPPPPNYYPTQPPYPQQPMPTYPPAAPFPQSYQMQPSAPAPGYGP